MREIQSMMPKARQEGLVLEEIGDEVVVYDKERHSFHSLDPTTALVWRHCDGQTSIPAIATWLSSKFGSTSQSVVWLALEQLQRARLLCDQMPPARMENRISRRDVLRTLKFAGLALLLPAVRSIS